MSVTHHDNDVQDPRLEHLVARFCGGRPSTVRVVRERHDHSSSYPAEIVTVRLATGSEIRFFLKDFGVSQRRKDEPAQQRDRELCVYRELLAGVELGTAEYRGSVWDEAQGRFWLLLEFVGGKPLRDCPFEYWVAAAGWLGRLQGYFARHPELVRQAHSLLRHDADFFWSKARAAMDAVSNLSARGAYRLAVILGRYEQCIEWMAGQPPTLVHGSYKPRNILIDVELLRICPVDWELAAAGSALYDLAFLAYGFEPPTLDHLLDAYRHEATALDLSLPDPVRMRRLVDCFRLHRVLKELGSAEERRFPRSRVDRLIEMAERLSHLAVGAMG